MIFVAKSLPTLLKYDARNIGRLLVPRSYERAADTARAGFLWCADNDAFNNFSKSRYMMMLDRIAGVPGCVFVAVPDVVGDHDATLDSFHVWRPVLGDYNLPTAFVAQDGCEPDLVPWDDIDVLFIGGTTEFKMGETARHVALEAKDARNKWVHMGRVNSQQRIRYASAIGCDSIDGSSMSMFTDTFLPGFAERAAAPRQTMLGDI